MHSLMLQISYFSRIWKFILKHTLRTNSYTQEYMYISLFTDSPGAQSLVIKGHHLFHVIR